MKNKELNIEKDFSLACQYHKEKKFKDAENLYKKILNIDSNHFKSIFLLGSLQIQTKNFKSSVETLTKVIQIHSNHKIALNYLGIAFYKLGEHKKAIEYFKKSIQIDPNYSEAYNNLGAVFKELGEHKKAIEYFKKSIQIDPNYSEAYNNLGLEFNKLGEYEKAIEYFKKGIKIDPNNSYAYNSLGIVFDELGKHKKAIEYFKKGIKIDPNNSDVYWNLHSHASNIDEALKILKKLYKIDNTFTNSKIMISALNAYKGNFNDFNDLMKSTNSNNPMIRSVNWVLSLPKIPKIFFNRWDFFNGIITLADQSRPFYEFGVWNGISFKYLINTFKKGFGFDTFCGLPEDWHSEPSGTYSSLGSIPKIKGGEFIVGKFENTLPKFFSQKRPLASIINFDADLYTSTLCALNNAKEVIDKNSILIFDEFLINDHWEKDEYKALNDFCNNLNIEYDVVAISFYSKQVAVKLKK